MAQAQVPPLSGVGESRAVDVLHQLRQSLGEEGQVDFVPDVVLGPLEQVQQGLQERSQLWAAERTTADQKPQSNMRSARNPSKTVNTNEYSRHFLKRVRHLSSAIRLQELADWPGGQVRV